jgi:hypothetical protein
MLFVVGDMLSRIVAWLTPQLLVHESGKMQLVIGEHRLIVSSTMQSLHAQSVVALDTDERSLVMMGDVAARAVVETDLDCLLGRSEGV